VTGARRPASDAGSDRHALSFGLGILTGQTRPGSGMSVSDEYRALISISCAAESLGFDSVWLSEHHGADDAYLPSLLPMLAAIAAVTEKVCLGTAILIPALHHPIELAESVAVVDQISRGRVILGLGLGWRKEEFASFGIPFSERAGRTAEIIGILRRLWSDDPEPFRGRYYQLDRMRIRPLPYRSGGPPIYLAGSKEKPIRRAAALADGLFYSRSGPTAASVQPTFDHVENALHWIEDERSQRGVGGPFPLTLLVNAFVCESDPWGIIGDGVDHQFLAYARWKKEDAGLTVSREDEQEAVRNGRMLMLAGDPRTLVSRLGPWIDVLLPRCPLNLVVKMHYPGVGESRTVEALKLFAKEVMPALKRRALNGVVLGSDVYATN
jgi:alkanesulfonate monooxygenase SsuD/methylene tetrahydromethanopterin reductase-like flavin-dependent oxidoreductase (luciferase family)